MKQIRAALIGIGGFGGEHIRILAKLVGEGRLQCTAFCDPNPAASPQRASLLRELGAKHYTDYRDMLDTHPGIDIVIIATPIPLHKPMFLHAMKRGIHVFTEKPPCVAIEDLEEMIAAADSSGMLGAVNFQNTSGQAFRLLLQTIQDGVIGKVHTVTGTGRYLRSHTYFQRTPWAGKLMLNGNYVLDGPICNALSHLLNNCLIAAGAGDPLRAVPRFVQAELYHCNSIESEDTSCIRIEAANGVQIYHYATLCSSEISTPAIRVAGTEGELLWSFDNHLTITRGNGETNRIEFPSEDMIYSMYENLFDVLTSKQERLLSSIQDCRSFVLAANGAFTSTGIIHPIPEHATAAAVDGSGRTCTHIPLIGEYMEQAAGQTKLFSELSISWGVPTTRVSMSDYKKLLVHPGVERF